MKKLICVFLGIAVVFSLAAGCSKDVTLGQTEATTRYVSDEELNQGLDQLGLDLGLAMAEADREALRRMKELNVTLPPDEPIVTMPPPMPTGAPIKAEDVYPLMEKVRNILTSKTFTLKARGAAPPTAGMPLGTTPVTFVSDGNKSAFEVEMNWSNMLTAMTQGTPEAGQAKINGAIIQTLMGKKVRFVTKPDGDVIVLLDKQKYMPLPKGEGEEGSEGGDSLMSINSMFGDVFAPPKNSDVAASKVTDNGKEYLCATIKGEEGLIMRYYFLDSNLKRIEMEAKNPDSGKVEVIVFEIDSLTATADSAMFSTAGFTAMSLDEMANLGGTGLDGFLG